MTLFHHSTFVALCGDTASTVIESPALNYEPISLMEAEVPPQWENLHLSVTCDPSLQQTRPQLYEKLNIDLLTWRTLITNALADMYGIVGEARHFDILAKQQKTPALDAVIRVMPEDKDVFITSLASYNFSLSDHLGQEYDVTASITVKNSSPYLGLLVTSELADL